ncbi:MAG: 23S rRNA (adenine(2503)-C(2))-methyltransferase RlmN [Lachnospiraceae bacterium]|nr:23S rRNA (adenine(2503)-C(2))-methyltransferase RlmN [Lachnospiraceae bacterium]
MEKADIKSFNISELQDFIEEMGEKKFRAKQIYEWLHIKLVTDFDDMTNISKDLKSKLKERCYITALEPAEVLTSKIDGTQKYLFRLRDGNVIESVLMKYKFGNSVCISTQVGCRMGCRFCASTLGGLERCLSTSEMLDEIYRIQSITGQRVSNVVLMGTGEPMDNYDNVIKLVKMLTDENGLHISGRNITISSCGLVENIMRLADEGLQITLALSLHASDDDTRKELMPIANKYTISQILDACRYYFEKTGRRVTFEYSLASGINDTADKADKLAKLLKGMHAHVNLIPINPIKERDYKQSDKSSITSFKDRLEKHGINVTIRREMGRDINGACGQLRKSYLETSENL